MSPTDNAPSSRLKLASKPLVETTIGAPMRLSFTKIDTSRPSSPLCSTLSPFMIELPAMRYTPSPSTS
ncbi:MAG TPA: hypothetical protein VF175_00980 [Lacipirellula sp.]